MSKRLRLLIMVLSLSAIFGVLLWFSLVPYVEIHPEPAIEEVIGGD
jgi:hypothetical protein